MGKREQRQQGLGREQEVSNAEAAGAAEMLLLLREALASCQPALCSEK